MFTLIQLKDGQVLVRTSTLKMNICKESETSVINVYCLAKLQLDDHELVYNTNGNGSFQEYTCNSYIIRPFQNIGR